MSKPVIVVFDATGLAGNGMIEAIMEDGTFIARAVTNDTNSDAVRSLTTMGIEVVTADLSDLSAVTNVMHGAHGVFGLTASPRMEELEEKHGMVMIDAAKAAAVKHLVWLALEHNHEWKPAHFESRARVNDYLIASGIPRTSLYASFIIESLKDPSVFGGKRDEKSGKVVLDPPYKTDGAFPVISALELGKCGLAAIKNPSEWINKDMKPCRSWMQARDLLEYLPGALLHHGVDKHVTLNESQWLTMRSNFMTATRKEHWLTMQTYYTAEPEFRDSELMKRLTPGPDKTKEFLEKWDKSAEDKAKDRDGCVVA